MGNCSEPITSEPITSGEISTAEGRRKAVDLIKKKVSTELYVDDHERATFLNDSATTIVNLVTGELVDLDGFKRLLLGKKGSGKTALSTAILNAASVVLGHLGLITIIISYNEYSHCDLPTDRILSQLSPVDYLQLSILLTFNRGHSRVSAIEEFLQARKLHVVVFIDELQNIFTKGCTNGKEIISELAGFGASKSGVSHWILCGSSSDLRPLVTAKLRKELKDDYPNYCGIDLNGTKFVPWTIYPFVDAPNFRGIISFLQKKRGYDVLTEEELGYLYFETGGNGREIASALAMRALGGKPILNSYCSTCKGISVDENTDSVPGAILRAITTTLDASAGLKESFAYSPNVSWDDKSESPTVEDTTGPGGSQNTLESQARFTTLVDYTIVRNIVIERFPAAANDIMGHCFDLADRGMVRLYERSRPCVKIGLCQANMMIEFWANATHCTIDEIVALRTGNSARDLDLAGNATLRFISVAVANKRVPEDEKLFSIKSLSGTAVYEIPSLYVGKTKPVNELPEVCNTMYKETLVKDGSALDRDGLGADGVVLEPTGTDNHYTAYRLQVKIKGGELKSAEDAVRRFKTNLKEAEDAYRRSGYNLDKQVLIYVTTENVHTAAREHFAKHGIVLWDRKFLSKYIWPPNIKSLGNKFK